MMINLKYIQMTIGIQQPFQHSDFGSMSHLLPNSWLKSIWEYTCGSGIFIDFTGNLSIAPQRQHDKCIMDILKLHFHSNELLFLNRIRIHLKLLTLADMTDSSGKRLLPNIIDGISHRKSTLQWPNQIVILKHLRLWKRACSILQSHLYSHALGYPITTHQIWEWKTNSDQTIITCDSKFFKKLRTRGRPSYVP